jgi:mannose-6-phosphate isomerase-like protein (cupin superfamily)
LINQIAFFKDKNSLFLSRIIPKLKPRGIYIGDSLYSQADAAEEIYFVTNGQFTMYVDMQKQVNLQKGTIDPNT